jgi:hypothetical protein
MWGGAAAEPDAELILYRLIPAPHQLGCKRQQFDAPPPDPSGPQLSRSQTQGKPATLMLM